MGIISINKTGFSPSVDSIGSSIIRVLDSEQSNNEWNTTTDNKQFIVIAGDSIARGTSETEGPTLSAGIAQEWNGSSLLTILGGDLSSAGQGSPWPQFALDYNTSTTRKLVFCTGADSGSAFSESFANNDNWNTTGNLYPALKTKTNNGLAFLGLRRPRAIFIILGINDTVSGVDLSQIQTDVVSLFDRMQTDWPHTPIHFINLGRRGADISNARIDAVRSYVENEVATRDDCFISYDLRIFATDFPEYYDADLVHLNQTGNNALGVILADFLENN